MKSDVNGCSTCQTGREQYEWFSSGLHLKGSWGDRRQRVQYDYRTPSGDLFSTLADTLEDARAQRDAWLAGRGVAKRGR